MNLSTFTLDEYESAIRHNTNDPPCTLIAEVHATLLYLLRSLTSAKRHTAVISLLHLRDEQEANGTVPVNEPLSIDELIAGMSDVGNNWERQPLKASENRAGWEESLVGCLKEVCRTLIFGLWVSAYSL